MNRILAGAFALLMTCGVAFGQTISFGPPLPLTGGSLTGPLHLGSNLLDGSNIAFTGGTLNGVSVGATTPGTGAFTTLGASGTATLGNGSANYVQIIGTAGNPLIQAAGTGPNLSLLLQGSGTGGVNIRNGSGQTIGQFIGQGSPVVNFLQFAAESSGTDPAIVSVGTNAGIRLAPATGGIITLSAPTLAQNMQLSP